MIMTDQDHDGSHIKGLIMNYFHTFYPSLLRVAGFLIEFITPVIKVSFGAAQPSQQRLPLGPIGPACFGSCTFSLSCSCTTKEQAGHCLKLHASSLLRYRNM